MKRILFFTMTFMLVTTSVWAMAKQPPPERPQPEEPHVMLSLTLRDCYQMALKRSETLAIRKEEVNRTLGSFLRSSGEIIGDFDYEFTDFHQEKNAGADTSSVANNNTGRGFTFNNYERRERKFVYSQPLFRGFRAVGALSGAGSLKKQRVGEWQRAKQLLFMDVANVFYAVLQFEKEIKILQGIIDASDERVKQLKEWEDIGRSRPSELANAQLRVESFRADLEGTKGALAVAQNLLSFLIGVTVEASELREEKNPEPSEDKVDYWQLVHARPDVEASRQAVMTARGNWIIAQSELWPTITLDTNMYEKREGSSSAAWDTLLTFRVPLGKGGTTLGKMKDAHSLWKEAKLEYSLTERTAEREIKDAYENWKSSGDRLLALGKAVDSAQKNFTLQTEEYKRRLASNLDVSEALESLFQAKRDENETFYSLQRNYWQLEIAKGLCCSEAAP